MAAQVQFYTGQYFDLERITKAAHKAGAMVALQATDSPH
jgi:kynureninase